jgi:hypothetical protein
MEHRLDVFEYWVLKKIFVGVAGGWRRLHDEEFNNLCVSPNTIRAIRSTRMRRAGHAARMGEKKNAYAGVLRKSEGRALRGRSRRR